MHACTHTQKHTEADVCMHTHTCTHTQNNTTHTHAHTHRSTQRQTCACTHTQNNTTHTRTRTHTHTHYLRTYLPLVIQHCTICLTTSLTGWLLDRFLLPGVFSLVEACMLLLEETDCDIRQLATRFVGNLQWDKKSPKVIHCNIPVCAGVHVGLYMFCKSWSLHSKVICCNVSACTCWVLFSVAWIVYFWDQCSVWNGISVGEFVSFDTVVDLGYSLVFGKSHKINCYITVFKDGFLKPIHLFLLLYYVSDFSYELNPLLKGMINCFYMFLFGYFCWL